MMLTKKPSKLLFIIRFLSLTVVVMLGIILLLASNLLFFAPEIQRGFRRKYFVISSKVMAWLCGYEIRVHGKLPEKPGLILPNHVSYGDILVLASLFPTCFVAKIQIKSWPFIGWMATLAGTIYVTRMKERQLLAVNESVKQRLVEGQNVVVFLEGKTSDGNAVHPFRSPILESVVGDTIPVIPVALKWHSDNPAINVEEHIAYWRDEHHLLTHLIGHLGHTGKIVECYIGEPECSSAFDCRKELASKVHGTVEAQWQQLVKIAEKR